MKTVPSTEKIALDAERWRMLRRLERWLETPMLVLGFVWLGLLVVEFIRGLSPLLQGLGTAIWIIFVIDFLLKLTLAPARLRYVRNNWLTLLALVLPALRVFRIVRVVRVLRLARAMRGLRLVRVLSSLNRGMKALGAAMGRRGFGYVVVLTLIVTVVGAAGMYVFENQPGVVGGGLDSYGAALWWTAMIMTTLGSSYWPESGEGRILCLVLALYAFAVFGYLTATLATFFIGRDADNEGAEVASAKSIAELRREVRALHEDLRRLSAKADGQHVQAPTRQPGE